MAARRIRKRKFRSRRRVGYGRKRGRTFKRRVRKALYNIAENKQVALDLGFTAANAFISTPLTPTFVQGTGDNQRIGNKVSLKWLTVWRRFRFLDPNQGPNSSYNTEDPLSIRYFLVSPKSMLSRSDAAFYLGPANFPLYGLPDQDNWYYHVDKAFSLGTGLIGAPATKYIKWYKKLNKNVQFASYNNTVDPMPIYEVIVSNYSAVVKAFVSQGYCKISFVDI